MAGLIYTASFSAVAVSVAQDLFEIVAPAAAPIFIREIRVGQYSDFADAQAELISILVIRGYTTSGGTGGTPPTPVLLMGGSLPASSATVEINNTVVASAGSPVTLVSDTFNVAAGFLWPPQPDMVVGLSPAERLVVRITAPTDVLTMNGTLTWEEGRGFP